MQSFPDIPNPSPSPSLWDYQSKNVGPLRENFPPFVVVLILTLCFAKLPYEKYMDQTALMQSYSRQYAPVMSALIDLQREMDPIEAHRKVPQLIALFEERELHLKQPWDPQQLVLLRRDLPYLKRVATQINVRSPDTGSSLAQVTAIREVIKKSGITTVDLSLTRMRFELPWTVWDCLLGAFALVFAVVTLRFGYLVSRAFLEYFNLYPRLQIRCRA